jgi:hypothetical protein
MKLQIKTTLGSVLFEAEANSIRELILGAVKSRANLYGANLSGADLSRANLSGADLYGANLSRANLSRANLSGANLSRANLSGADLSRANLSRANLSGADLSRANLSGADLYGANLSRANLSGADLSRANLSGAGGLGNFDALEWFRKNFKKTRRGVIVYKCFNGSFPPNPAWKIEPGSVISENCGPMPTDSCACGINFATREWVEREHPDATIWRCLIPWAWLPGVVIPWSTDGKARCSKLVLLREEKKA